MKGLTKLTPINAVLNLEIKLEECLDAITKLIKGLFVLCQVK